MTTHVGDTMLNTVKAVSTATVPVLGFLAAGKLLLLQHHPTDGRARHLLKPIVGKPTQTLGQKLPTHAAGVIVSTLFCSGLSIFQCGLVRTPIPPSLLEQMPNVPSRLIGELLDRPVPIRRADGGIT